jgi:hypothetical protein
MKTILTVYEQPSQKMVEPPGWPIGTFSSQIPVQLSLLIYPALIYFTPTNENAEHGIEPAGWPIATLSFRRPMGITLTVSCASESVMEKDLSFHIGLLGHRPMRSILFFYCAADGTATEPPD